MRNIFLFGLVLLCLVYLSESKRWGGGSSSRGSSRGSSSSSSGWGKSWGSSSSRSGGSSSWGSSGSSYKPSYSWNTGSSSGSSWNKPSHSYPSSGGLSGSGSGSHSYPSSTGLSGSGSRYPSYPASTGLSGSGSRSPSYPASTGLSGFGSSHNYPSSTGLSGSGSSSRYPSYPSSTGWSGSGSRSPSYPASTGLSGTSSYNYPSRTGSNSYKPSYSSGSHSYLSGTHNSGTNNVYGYHPGTYVPYTYHTAPQHVYITQYRDSGSRYSDLLTGLAMYDLGRSHSYHNHYYYDDYYRHHYYPSYSSGNSYRSEARPEARPEKEAVCSLIVKEDGKTNVLKVPCQIVSTFTEDSKKIEIKRVCTSNVTYIKRNSDGKVEYVTNLKGANITSNNIMVTNLTADNNIALKSTLNTDILSNTTINNSSLPGLNNTSLNTTLPTAANVTDAHRVWLIALRNASNNTRNAFLVESTIQLFNKLDSSMNKPPNSTLNELLINAGLEPLKPSITTTESPKIENKTVKYENTYINGTAKISNITIISPNETFINITVCNETNSYALKDPLNVKGDTAIDPSKMECEVDIKTQDAHFRQKVDCNTLMHYSKKPTPKKDAPLLPERETLKSWLNKPPWWASVFISV